MGGDPGHDKQVELGSGMVPTCLALGPGASASPQPFHLGFALGRMPQACSGLGAAGGSQPLLGVVPGTWHQGAWLWRTPAALSLQKGPGEMRGWRR